MKNIQDNIEQLEDLFQKISEQLKPYLQSEMLTAKQNQLHAIESTIQKLQKESTPIPEDLRDLKLKLVCEIEEWQDAEKVKKNLYAIQQKYKHLFQSSETKTRPKKRRKRKKRKTKLGRRIEVVDILKAGIMPKDTVIFRTYKGIRYEAHVADNGKIETVLNGRNLKFDSPSAAAKELTNLEQNGWTWWFVSVDGKKRELDYYRKEYIKNETERRR